MKAMNPMPDGMCRTIKYQYQKNGFANFTRGGAYGATAVIEIYENLDSADEREGSRGDCEEHSAG